MSLVEHLRTRATTVCRCWSVERTDGTTLGFTDHDQDISFAGLAFRADSGMTARAFQQSTGLSVDNSEAIGALSDAAIAPEDIEAGRYDDAKVVMWLVNWQDTDQRMVRFAGNLGEIVRSGSSFRAELRGLTESLNRSQGLVYQRTCSAILGDRRCKVDLSDPQYRYETIVEEVNLAQTFGFKSFPDFEPSWFGKGRLDVVSGPAEGLGEHIKSDLGGGDDRRITLWQALRAGIRRGDRIVLVAGCDKRSETCRTKFANYVNFRGFPHIPGEDWLMAYPNDRVPSDGGRL